MQQSPLSQGNTVPKLVKNFTGFYGTRRFITTYTTARHLSLSWDRSIQFMFPFPSLEYPLYCYRPIYAWVFQVVFFPQVSPWKPCIHLCQVRGFCDFRNMVKLLQWGVVSTSFNLLAGKPPVVGCPRLLIPYIRSYTPYLEAVPEDAPSHCDMDYRINWLACINETDFVYCAVRAEYVNII